MCKSDSARLSVKPGWVDCFSIGPVNRMTVIPDKTEKSVVSVGQANTFVKETFRHLWRGQRTMINYKETSADCRCGYTSGFSSSVLANAMLCEF